MGFEPIMLGIIALFTWIIPFAGLPIPIIGLVWGILNLRRTKLKKWKPMTGVALCSVGLVLSVGYTVLSVVDSPPSIFNGPTITPTSTYKPTPTITQIEWLADGTITNGEYDNTRSFSSGYTLHWSIEGDYILVGIKANTSGWVAFGIQPQLTSQTNIDMVLGYVSSNGVTVFDIFINDSGDFSQDKELGGQNDIVEYGGAEERNSTTIEFKRLLDTGDRDFDLPLLTRNYILWAYGASDSRDTPALYQGVEILQIP